MDPATSFHFAQDDDGSKLSRRDDESKLANKTKTKFNHQSDNLLITSRRMTMGVSLAGRYERVFSKTNHRVRYQGIAKNQFTTFIKKHSPQWDCSKANFSKNF